MKRVLKLIGKIVGGLIGLIVIAIVTRITSYNVCYTKLLRCGDPTNHFAVFERHSFRSCSIGKFWIDLNFDGESIAKGGIE